MSSFYIRPAPAQFWVENLKGLLVLFPSFLMTTYLFVIESDYMVYLSLLTFSLLSYVSYRWFELKAHTWIICQEEIIQKVGLLSVTTDHIEMYRIIDYQEQQSLLQRLLGVKTIILVSTDKTTPELCLKGLPNQSNLLEVIRGRVELCKTNKRIYEITNH